MLYTITPTFGFATFKLEHDMFAKHNQACTKGENRPHWKCSTTQQWRNTLYFIYYSIVSDQLVGANRPQKQNYNLSAKVSKEDGRYKTWSSKLTNEHSNLTG